jgi:hypothetical protein
MAGRLLRLAGILLLFVAAMQRPAERVIAIGDVHGDLARFTAILQKAELIDEKRQWIGGKATLVQLGDLIDRGPQSRATLDFVMNLQKDAAAHGGSVLVSLGNHEVMNIVASVLYVVPADYASFADSRSEERRKAAFQEFARFAERRGRPVNEQTWMRFHPLGFVEYREAFGPNGKYGKWLRGLPAVNQVGDSLFVHGGINTESGFKDIAAINSAVKTELQAFDSITRYMIDKGIALPFFALEEFVQAAEEDVQKTKPTSDENRARLQIVGRLLQARTWTILNDGGPLWFRGYNTWSDADGELNLTQLSRTFGVKRFIVAHTPQPGGLIRSRFGGKAFLIDTGAVVGRPSALEIVDSRLRALYLNSQVDLD